MDRLKGIYKGQSVWIIGKGPSLQYLGPTDIDMGPIITLNEAIMKIEEFDFPNPVYSMQKDGGKWIRIRRHHGSLKVECERAPKCGNKCGHMIRPRKGGALLIHRQESLPCFPDYSPRHIFDAKEFGIPKNEFSLIMAIKIGQFMGCSRFCFVSCDVHVNGDIRTFIPGEGLILTKHLVSQQVKRLKPYLKDLDCEWITPTAKKQEALNESPAM